MVHTLSVLLIGAALSQLALILIKLWQKPDRNQAEVLYGCLNLSVLVHFTYQLHLIEAWSLVADPIRTAVPGLFWLTCGAIFQEGFRLNRLKLSLVAATVLLPLLYRTAASLGTVPGLFERLLVDLPQLLEFVLIGWGLYLVSSSFRDDLIEARRELRIWVFGLSGTIILVAIFERQVVQLHSEVFELSMLTASVALFLILNVFFLRWENNVFDQRKKEEAEAEVAEVAEPEDPLLLKLTQLLEQSQVYRSHGLTIGALANQLGVTPHKLRALINDRLGHRNFNGFLNHYRVEEASSRLRDEDTPVLNIALDVGFKSLTSFNKSFRDLHGKTPTDFRRSQNAG